MQTGLQLLLRFPSAFGIALVNSFLYVTFFQRLTPVLTMHPRFSPSLPFPSLFFFFLFFPLPLPHSGDAKLAVDFAREMLKEGIYVVAFSYPVVPLGKARIRVQISAGHDETAIRTCVKAFATVRDRLTKK